MSQDTSEPEILEAEWDREQVEALFDDLQQGAVVQHVQVRTASKTGPGDQAVTLSEAHQLLQQGDAKAIQIRYEFNGQSWCDTLMVGPTSIRIIRTAIAE